MTATSGKIRNKSGQDLTLPEFGDRLVEAGEAVPVPIDRVTAYTQQLLTWEPFDAPAKAAHDEMLEAIAYLNAVAASEQEALEHRNEPVEEQLAGEPSAKDIVSILIPALNAEGLAELVSIEEARPAPRKTVLKAAEKRAAELDELDDPDDDNPDADGAENQES